MCGAKAEGGLGVRALATQNNCRLLKLFHRLHAPASSWWASWVWSRLRGNLLGMTRASAIGAPHWGHLARLVPLYRDLTTVKIGDDRHASFWDDDWAVGDRLSVRFPALASHTTDHGASVWDVKTRGIDTFLVPRLSGVVVRERDLVATLLGVGVSLLRMRPTCASSGCATRKKTLWPPGKCTPSSPSVASGTIHSSSSGDLWRRHV